MKTSLKSRIFIYFKRNPGIWIPGAEIERLTQQQTKHIASTASRILRQLAEDGQLEREMRYSGQTGHKKIAYFRYKQELSPEEIAAQEVKWFDSLPQDAKTK